MRLVLMAALAACLHVFAAAPAPPLEIGNGQVTVVTFLSARCPVSNAYGDRLQELFAEYKPRGVRFLFLNPNVNETDSEIAENAKGHAFSFPVTRDPESRMAIRLGAEFTPEVYLFDDHGTLRYHGGIDDAQNPARVKVQSLRVAIESVLAGKPVNVTVTKAFGCTVKRPRHVP